MSAVLKDGTPQQRPMALADLDAVLPIENAAYAFPWSRGNFIDSLIAGYPAEVLLAPDGSLLGYWVGMVGVDEMHLLNLTVAPALQRRGHGGAMLDALVERCRARGDHQLWLEVRSGNVAAQALYRRRGFVQVGVRRGYYPAGPGRREDALVMQLLLRGPHALD